MYHTDPFRDQTPLPIAGEPHGSKILFIADWATEEEVERASSEILRRPTAEELIPHLATASSAPPEPD
jgi:hypothetical protein